MIALSSGGDGCVPARGPGFRIQLPNISDAEPDVRAGGQTGGAAVQGEDTGGGTAGPAAAADRKALADVPHVDVVSAMAGINRE